MTFARSQLADVRWIFPSFSARAVIVGLSAISSGEASVGIERLRILGGVGPETRDRSMIDILLMIVIGGMGTMYGAVIGAVLVVLAEYYLQNILGAVHGVLADVPVISALFHPDRWLLWLGVLFVLIVTFFPQGIFGWLRHRR